MTSGPAIRSLTLRRFRNHTSFERSFSSGLIILIGPNGVGKTNILEAVTMLSPGRGLRGATADEMTGQPDGVGWSVEATFSRSGAEVARSGPAEAVARTAYDPAFGKRTVRIDGETVPQTALSRLARQIWLTPAMDRLWIEGASGRRRFLDRLTLAFEPDHGAAAAAYEKAMRERNRLLKDGRPAPSWLDALEARMAGAASAIVGARARAVGALTEAAAEARDGGFPVVDLALTDEALDDLGDASQDAASIADRARRAPDPGVFAARWASERLGDAAAGRTRFGPHRSDLRGRYVEKDRDAAQCSTGEQKALLISLILAAARSLAARDGEAPIVLLDEIAAHLDPDRRAALFDALERAAAQVWMTGADASDFSALEGRADILALQADAS